MASFDHDHPRWAAAVQMVKDFEIGGSNRHVQILNKVRSWGGKPNAFGDGII